MLASARRSGNAGAPPRDATSPVQTPGKTTWRQRKRHSRVIASFPFWVNQPKGKTPTDSKRHAQPVLAPAAFRARAVPPQPEPGDGCPRDGAAPACPAGGDSAVGTEQGLAAWATGAEPGALRERGRRAGGRREQGDAVCGT